MRFRLEANQTDELDRNLRLAEQVLRHLIVRAEEVPAPRTIARTVSVVEETKE
jgi:ribosomal protein S6